MTALHPFTYEALPMRVRFAESYRSALRSEIEVFGLRNVLVLSTPERRTLADGIIGHVAGVYRHAQMHVPIDVARQARTTAEKLSADGYVAIGGGSTIGLARP
jgi:maleylacetate reductase